MTAHDPRLSPPAADASNSRLIRIAIWVAIGALIAAALVCVVWVLVGPSNDVIGRAFLTILLLAAFAGVAILDAHLAARRPAWFALTSMIVWVVTLLAGAFLIWMPFKRSEFGYNYGSGFGRFLSFLLIVLVLQLAVLHLRLYTKSFLRRVTGFTTAVGYITLALVAILAVMLVVPLVVNEFVDFGDWYWRLVVAITILAAVGTALIPLTNVLFAPKKPRAVGAPGSWPTYADGATPLPVLPDGTPDWNAYYTGHPTPGAQAVPAALPQGPAAWPAPAAPAQTWTDPAHQWAVQQSGPQQYATSPQWEAAQQPAPQQAPQDWHAPHPAPQQPGTQWPPLQQDAAAQGWPAPAPQVGYDGYPPVPPLPPQPPHAQQ
jgi:MFS family permease